MTEKWKDIDGYEGYYQVSDNGRVRSLDRTVPTGDTVRRIKGVVLKPGSNVQGYPIVSLQCEGMVRGVGVNRLVANAFIPNHDNLPEAHHIDHDKTNNNVSNLQWVTCSQNAIEAYKAGARRPTAGEVNGMAKLTEDDVREILRLLSTGLTQREVAVQFNMSNASICRINAGDAWAHINSDTIQ